MVEEDSFSIVEASIAEVLAALKDGRATATELVRQTLDRIAEIDAGPDGLNAVVVLNPDALADAAESDARLAAGTERPLEGVPYTIKDSYMAKGLTVAAGSPAFANLIAQEDAFTVARLRAAGAVLIGKTNMPPMADGGMQRGLYGRAESPYNKKYLAAAYASGSSNGSGAATAASIGVFGMGEETVSSGRSPASNNALCAYTPSWGVLSIRGNWPLFPARDVVVPHTRSMPDMLQLLDVLVADDNVTRGDFWRHQGVVKVLKASEHRPRSYTAITAEVKEQERPLAGLRFAAPRMYTGTENSHNIQVRDSIVSLWLQARDRLEALGAEIIDSDFKLIEKYEGDKPGGENVARLGVLPEGWMDTEFNHFLAYGWEDFLRANADPQLNTLAQVDPDEIFPTAPGQLPDRYEEVANYADRYRETVRIVQTGINDPRTRTDFAAGLRGILRLRQELFDDWLKEGGYDGVVFPANADVGRADADVDPNAADHAWANGVFFSNGNYALRHLGIPTVTVPMGVMSDTDMPVGLTFAGRAGADVDLLRWASAFESPGSLRQAPKYLR